MKTIEMRVLFLMFEIILRNEQRNTETRSKCQVEDVVKSMKERQKGLHHKII